MSLPSPKRARLALKISQRELARRVPTTQMSVYLCEKNGTYPKHPALRIAYLRALKLGGKTRN